LFKLNDEHVHFKICRKMNVNYTYNEIQKKVQMILKKTQIQVMSYSTIFSTNVDSTLLLHNHRTENNILYDHISQFQQEVINNHHPTHLCERMYIVCVECFE
jgi:elongation factor P--beta-lysine ligase